MRRLSKNTKILSPTHRAKESAKVNDNASQRENLNLDESLGEKINNTDLSAKIDSKEASFTSKELNK